MNDHISNLIDRYLYPDQIVFGGIFNPNLKLSHPMQLTKSSAQAQQNDEIVIYVKSMSQVKIKSMLSMMEGNHPPLFKSAIVGSKRPQSQQQDYEDQDDYGMGYEDQDQYEGYDDEMYLMEKDYEDYFQDQYDDEENPIMALGHSAGALPKIKDYNFKQKSILKLKSHITHPTHALSKLTHSQQLPNKKQQGLGQILGINFANNEDLFGSKANIPDKTIIGQTKIKKQAQTKKSQNNDQEDEDWQTQSQEQVQQNKQK